MNKEPVKIQVDPKRVDILPSEAEENDHEETPDHQEGLERLHVLSEFWYARIFCLVFFLLALVGLAFSCLILVICVLNAIVRLFSGDQKWLEPLKNFSSALVYGFVFTFCFFVGIFSPSLALKIVVLLAAPNSKS